MAQLIPHHHTSQIEQPGERLVAEALCAQLPADVVIIHSYPWLRPERNERSGKVNLQEGEADFVILHPRFGIMVVEVKDGNVYYDPRTMRWERHGAQHQVKDPFVQAAKNLHTIEERAERYFKNGLPFTRAFCVVFPRCEWSGNPPPGAVNANLFAASDLPRLGTRIEALFRAFDRRPQHTMLPTPVLNSLMRTLTSEFKLTPALWQEVAEQERIIFRYTQDQLMILDLLQEHKRAAIQGVAGSGKTQLALAKARAFADEGKKVLLLCYNRMLADWLVEQVRGQKDRITAINYHRMAREWCVRAKLPFPASSDDDAFWTKDAAHLFENALERLDGDRYDAVVVDEGQDFHESWWDSVEWLNCDTSDGPLYVFYDPSQQLQHHSDQRLPKLGKPFQLPCNCRNTQRISLLCAAAIKQEIRTKPGQPEGREPIFKVAADEISQRAEITACLKHWLSGTGGITKRQVAILCPASVAQSSLRQLTALGGVELTENPDDWRADKAVLLTTLRKFKGLEADAVILFDAPLISNDDSTPDFSNRHFYVACSRAKHLLCVIAKTQALIKQLQP